MERAYSQGVVTKSEVFAAGIPAGDDRWSGMLRLVASEYPFCTMSGVHLAEGCIVACEGIQRSFVFSGSDASVASAEPAFDAHWKALQELCAKIGSGRLAEIRFSRGRPVSARMSEGGRRFRRLVVKTAPQNKERSPMS